MTLAFAPSSGVHNLNIMDVFGRASAPKLNGNVVDNAIGNTQTAMAKVSGTNFVANLPKVNMQAFKPDSTNHISNLSDITGSAQATRNQVASVGANFKSEVAQVQKTMDAAMKQASQNLNIDFKRAQDTIKPPPASTHVGAGAMMAADLAFPGAPAVIGAAVQAVSEYRSERGKLKPEQEAKLMDEMQALLSPKRDENGNIVAPAKVPTSYSFDKIQPADLKETIRELYKPAEQQHEGQIIASMLHELDEEVLPHLTQAEDRQHHNTGNKLAVAVGEGDIDAVQNITNGADAIEIAAAMQAGASLADAQDTPSASEILMQSGETLPFLSGLEVSKAPSISPDVKTAMTSLNNEFRPAPAPETSLGFNNAAA